MFAAGTLFKSAASVEKAKVFSMPVQFQTWLQVDGKLHRPSSSKELSKQEFADQVEDDVRYTIFKFMDGTYSNGKGGRSRWKKAYKKYVKKLKRMGD